MTIELFKQSLRDFLVLVYPTMPLQIDVKIQPNGGSFGWAIDSDDETTPPINPRIFGKSKLRELYDQIELLHRATTNHGLNKWNRATFRIDTEGGISHQFIWDEAMEEEEIKSFIGSAAVRAKWYWEETTNSSPPSPNEIW